jgi:hypothetical protein
VAVALPDPDEVRTWTGMELLDRAGRPVGRVAQVYTDDASGVPEWALARLGNVAAPVPLVDAVRRGGRVQVSVLRDEVMLAPAVRDERHITPDEEERLYRHYGIDYSGERSRSLLPAGEGPEPAPRQTLSGQAVPERRAGRWLLLPSTVVLIAVLVAWIRALRRRPSEDRSAAD